MALSTIKTASIANDAVTTDKIVNDGNLGNRNLLINGAMNVAQRGTSATGLGSGGTFTYNSQDRWYFLTVGSAAARFTQTVSTDVPDNTDFSTSLKLECTTASGTVGAAHRQQIGQKLEAQNNQALRYGKSNAKSATLSFWVKATKTGKNYAWLYTGDANKFSYISYTINTSNTWEYKTVTFTGDTVASIANDNGEGLSVIWMLYLGSDYTSDSSGSENTWIAWNSSNYDQFHGQVNHADSTSNSFLITGTQLEIGDVATPFEHEDFGTTLAKCQRYYEQLINHSGGFNVIATYRASSDYRAQWLFKTEKRANPTMGGTFSGALNVTYISTQMINYYRTADFYGNSTLTADAEL